MAGQDNRISVSWSILHTLAVWLVSGLLAWSVVQSRIAVLEERVDQLRTDLAEIKSDIKILIRRN
jgi:hypothetical protein